MKTLTVLTLRDWFGIGCMIGGIAAIYLGNDLGGFAGLIIGAYLVIRP